MGVLFKSREKVEPETESGTNVLEKRKLRAKAELSVNWLIYIPTSTCGHEL